MKKALLLSVLFFSLSLSLSGFSFNGFIITLDGKHISGEIQQINTIKKHISVIFYNDFGTVYSIHPALIKGFVYKKNSKTYIYESCYQQEKWLFFQLIYQGDELSLFKMPDIQYDWKWEYGTLVSHKPSKKYWIRNGRKQVVELKRRHFKKKLSNIIKKKAPALAQKIGQKGYRYHDLPKILTEYNQIINSDVKNL